MKDNVYIATLKLFFDRHAFFEGNDYYAGDSVYIIRQFTCSNFSIAYYRLFDYLEYETVDGFLSFCSVDIISLVKCGDSES